MEECPKCGHMSAERNHYTGLLICYNRSCDFEEISNEKEAKQRTKPRNGIRQNNFYKL
jgi:hypothetical protein